jgi:hypothetical protein
MSKVRETVLMPDIDSAKHLLGKTLRHVRHNDDKTGYVFCFGDAPEVSSGGMILTRLERVDERVELRMYCSGEWHDIEKTVSSG